MPNELRDLPFALSLGMFTFLLVGMWGGPFVEILHKLHWGKKIRRELDILHHGKTGTPTSGGILILIPTIVITLGLNMASIIRESLTGQSILIPLFVLVVFGLLGFYDDAEGILGKAPIGEGISARTKFSGQLLLAGGAAAVMSFGEIQFANSFLFPLIPVEISIPRLVWIPIAMFIIVGMSNAINITDGLDGLAGIISATAFAAYGAIASLQGQSFLVLFCFIVVGACFGFLWYNAKPAQLFMGDVGSLAIGATLGTVALMTGQWIVLPLIAIIPVATTLSVIIQVSYFKYTGGKRFFKMAPLHHHFEKVGWSETQIVQRFWLVAVPLSHDWDCVGTAMSQELYPLAQAFHYTPQELSLNRQKKLAGSQWRRHTLRFMAVTLGGLLLTLAPMLVGWGLVIWSTQQALGEALRDQRAWLGYGLGLALGAVYVATNYRDLLLGFDLLLGRVRVLRGKGRLVGHYLLIGEKYRFLLDESAHQALQDDFNYRLFILPYSQTLLSIEYAE